MHWFAGNAIARGKNCDDFQWGFVLLIGVGYHYVVVNYSINKIDRLEENSDCQKLIGFYVRDSFAVLVIEKGTKSNYATREVCYSEL